MEMPKLRPIPIPTRNRMFIARLWVWVTSVRKWEVLEDWHYTLTDEGPEIIIPKGFVFDGASIPRPLWAVLSPVGLLLIPGLIHDFAYRYTYLWASTGSGRFERFGIELPRLAWDRLFLAISVRVNGMAGVAFAAWLALVLFGWLAWRNNRRLPHAEVRPGEQAN